MQILADENIPYICEYFGSYGQIILKSGREITREDVLKNKIDLLIIRSVTKVNNNLLNNTFVKFVGSAVSGTDHLDIDFLEKNSIAWSAAIGCNTTAVVEYVMSVIAALQKKDLLRQKKPRAGVIGVGRIGQQIVGYLHKLGCEVLQCDPLRADKEKDFIHTPIEKLYDLDFISLHTPLTFTGKYPTYHLIEKNFLSRQKAGCILLNTSRGEVINSADLKQYGQHLMGCFDVWENEPQIDLEILEKAFIATPHIAGHSIQAKQRGIYQIYEAAWEKKIVSGKKMPCLAYSTQTIRVNKLEADRQDIILAMYNPLDMTHIMKQALLKKWGEKNSFDKLRKDFIHRSEFDFITLLF